jgi:hypothetical protein
VDLIQFYCTSNRREKALLSARQHQQNARNNHHKKITEQNKRHVVVVVVVGGLAAWDGTVRYPFRTPVRRLPNAKKEFRKRERKNKKRNTRFPHSIQQPAGKLRIRVVASLLFLGCFFIKLKSIDGSVFLFCVSKHLI